MKTIMTCITVLVVGAVAHAQAPPEKPAVPRVEITTTSEAVTENTIDWDDEKNRQSRMGMTQNRLPGINKVLKTTTEVTTIVNVETTRENLSCESEIDLEYFQKDTMAEVRTLYSSANCVSFTASYQLRISFYDDKGDLQQIEAEEQWPAGLKGRHRTSYALSPDSRLQRVTSKTVSCSCNQKGQN